MPQMFKRPWRRAGLVAAAVILASFGTPAVGSGLGVFAPAAAATSASAVAIASTKDGNGAWVAYADGRVEALGSAVHHGDMSAVALNAPVHQIVATGTGGGYWLVAADGGIFSFGDAHFLGSMGGHRLNAPVVSMAPTPTGFGYWLVASDGGIFAFGDAGFAGSMGGDRLNRPADGITASPSGHGYRMVADDGGVFSFGDAAFYGSSGGTSAAPVVAMAAAPGNTGYWTLESDGTVLAYGSALPLGGGAPGRPVVGIAGTPGAQGYLLLSGDGSIQAFGAAPGNLARGGALATWTTFGGSTSRQGSVPGGPDPASLHRRWLSPTLDGLVYGTPLVASGMVFAVTEGDSVDALDVSTGASRWHTHLGDPVPKSQLPCGDIDPTGITGTPVLDTAASLLYAVAFVEPGRHDLVALDLATGSIRWRVAVDPPGLSGIVEQQRGALLLANGRVYIPYGGLAGDCGQYKGALVSVDVTTHAVGPSWETPTERMGGLWAPPGASVDGQGNVFVAVGNAASTDPANFDGGNSVQKLSPTLGPISYFAPTNWATLSASDADLGSTSPIRTDAGRVVVAGKDGKAYLLDATNLGGIGGQLATVQACPSGAFGGLATRGTLVAVGCSGGPSLVNVAADSTMTLLWHAAGGRTGAPVIAGTTVWVEGSSGHVQAFDTSSGHKLADVFVGASAPGFPSPAVLSDLIIAPAGTAVIALGN